jgi:uncharacterized membrane protein YoaK (UPF0700 family)
MFRHDSHRTDRQNRQLAGYLAFVGGFVNSVGFALIGTFTSHVTGSVGHAAHDLVAGNGPAGLGASAMVFAFFFGAFLASVIVESAALGHPSRAYAAALAVEAALLGAFAAASAALPPPGPRARDAEALLLCAAMGMQNSLVTRLSGAVVRTTHLTGVVTDLGIEAARWLRYWRGAAAAKLHVPLVVGRNAAERPLAPKALLLLTIAGAFAAGALAGSALVARFTYAAMGFASVAVLLFAAYAARFARERDEDMAKSRR